MRSPLDASPVLPPRGGVAGLRWLGSADKEGPRFNIATPEGFPAIPHIPLCSSVVGSVFQLFCFVTEEINRGRKEVVGGQSQSDLSMACCNRGVRLFGRGRYGQLHSLVSTPVVMPLLTGIGEGGAALYHDPI